MKGSGTVEMATATTVAHTTKEVQFCIYSVTALVMSASLVLSDQLGILPPRAPTIFVTVSWGTK